MFFRVFLNKRREKNNFMKKTNRIIALAMAAMTALSMTACSGSAKETTLADSAAESTAEDAEESSAVETKVASGETLL